MYQCLYWLHNNGVYSSRWILYIENILNHCGLGYIWMSQGMDISLKWLKVVVKERLQAHFVAQWHSDMERSSKCDYYRNYKNCFELENYLDIVPPKVYKVILKFKTCNHKLPIETGRYANIERRFRICSHCNLQKVGDEFHYLFECSHPKIIEARRAYLPVYYHTDICIVKFNILMQNLNNVQ